MVEGFFGGLTLSMPVRELLFGIKSDALSFIKNRNPAIGGDPTVDDKPIMLHKNETFFETRYTGQKNATKAGNYYSMNSINYVNYNKSIFNGNETYIDYVSPWEKKVPYAGGDTMFGPKLTDYSIPTTFQPDFYREFRFKLSVDPPKKFNTKNFKGHDLETKVYEIMHEDFTVSPENNRFYLYKFNGAFNLTSLFRAPVF